MFGTRAFDCVRSALWLTMAFFGTVLFIPYLRFPLQSVCPEIFHLLRGAEASGVATQLQPHTLSHPLPLTVSLKDFWWTVAFHFQLSHLTQFFLHQEDGSWHEFPQLLSA